MSNELRLDGNTAGSVDAYRGAIGKGRRELTTPALILDLDIARRNIATMAEWTRSHAKIRPHVKIHKCPQIARLQLAAGAIGLTTATVWETAAMVQAGFDNILIANEVVGEEKVQLLATLAREASVIVVIDDPTNAEQLSRAAIRAGSRIGALVDIDIGLGRCGVRSDEDALRVAAAVSRLPGLELRGVMGYEGWVVMEPDPALRAQKAREAIAQLVGRIEKLERAGFSIGIVSAGGTNTYDMTGAIARVTELQAGSYVVMDAAYAAINPAFKPALTVLGTVISRQGATAVLDCGTKTFAMDLGKPRPVGSPVTVREVHEEHTLLDVGADQSLAPGDRVELVIGYCGGTTNLHEVYHVVERDRVIDIWPILARGDGRGSMN
jgi:D-serine deaminase-like pyridoxal phosphate-dependent protein